MANVKITGTGKIADSDYRYIKWVGKTKKGSAIQIELPLAICLSNPNWTFGEKTEAVPEVEFSACYEDEKLFADDLTEPWTLTGPEAAEGAKEIQLGAGRFYIGTTSADAKYVGLTRGGGSFVVERAYREVNADDDPGPVKGRIHQDEGRPKLKLNVLEWVDKIPTLYAGMSTAAAT